MKPTDILQNKINTIACMKTADALVSHFNDVELDYLIEQINLNRKKAKKK